MVTVSELAWHETIQMGKCPCCGKEKPLGILNIPWADEEDAQRGPRCIDCFFGPPEPDFNSFPGEEEDDPSTYRDCQVCGGEFWDGGTSCTCYETGETGQDEKEIVEDIIKEQMKEALEGK
jgi:hypothetical protein